MLAPSPGAPGEFLATVASENGEDLPFEITVDNYTRECWGLGRTESIEDSDIKWQVVQLQGIDGRNKLPGEDSKMLHYFIHFKKIPLLICNYDNNDTMNCFITFSSNRILQLPKRAKKVCLWNIYIT